MALNIKNPEAQELANEVARLSGQSITAAVIDALRDRKELLERRSQRARRLQLARGFLKMEVWPLRDAAGAAALTEDDLLGFGESGA
jgi:antitoxin VapB